jgi:hypothetical protein
LKQPEWHAFGTTVVSEQLAKIQGVRIRARGKQRFLPLARGLFFQ